MAESTTREEVEELRWLRAKSFKRLYEERRELFLALKRLDEIEQYITTHVTHCWRKEDHCGGCVWCRLNGKEFKYAEDFKK